jgi:hypothetical protein
MTGLPVTLAETPPLKTPNQTGKASPPAKSALAPLALPCAGHGKASADCAILTASNTGREATMRENLPLCGYCNLFVIFHYVLKCTKPPAPAI